jgi:hypothetical protein
VPVRSVLAWFTVRGASFLAAGIVGILAGLILGSGGKFVSRSGESYFDPRYS